MNIRRITLLAATALFALHTQAQEKAGTTVPAAVNKAFAERFPNAEQVKWDMEDANTYEAEFKLNGAEHPANFTAEGEWKETEMEVKGSAIPEAIRITLAKDYADHKVKECERVERSGTGMNYEVELAREGTRTLLLFDVTGKVLSTKTKSGKEKEEDED